MLLCARYIGGTSPARAFCLPATDRSVGLTVQMASTDQLAGDRLVIARAQTGCMARRRRGRDRAHHQARSLGTAIKLHRRITGSTVAAAATRAGLASSTWHRIENGAPAATLAALVAAADAVGLDLVCQAYPGRGPGLRDSGQLAIARFVASQASARWSIGFEVPAGDHSEAADVVLRGPDEVVAIEIERFLLDWQSQHRRAALKREWLATRHDRPVRLVIFVSDSVSNRTALSPFLSTLRAAMPAGSREVMRAIRSGVPLGSDGLAWVRLPPGRANTSRTRR